MKIAYSPAEPIFELSPAFKVEEVVFCCEEIKSWWDNGCFVNRTSFHDLVAIPGAWLRVYTEDRKTEFLMKIDYCPKCGAIIETVEKEKSEP